MKSVSHTLTWALRHGALDLRLRIASDGYCPVQDLIEHTHPKLKKITSLDQLQPVVQTSDKQRFRLELRPANLYATMDHSRNPWSTIELTPEQAAPTVLPEELENLVKGDDERASKASSLSSAAMTYEGAKTLEENGFIWCIRANQGHSFEGINPDFLLTLIPPDELASLPVIVHGTYYDAWKQIQTSGGLSRMGRTHIHCAAGLPGDNGVISGMRKSSQVYIYLNGTQCAADGIRFHRSDNGVLLTAGVGDEGILPLKYISHVRDKSGKTLLDQRNQS